MEEFKSKVEELYGDFLREIREIEKKWQREWYGNGIFNADPRPNKPKYFITVPYPYVSGSPHIGHGRTFTIGDIIARYKRARGFNVLFPIAWHITGTPIQSVADRIMKGDPEDIKLYSWYVSLYVDDPNKVKEILSTFTNPWNIAQFFASVYIRDFMSMGYSMDFRRQFTTGDPDYNAFIIWQYHKLREAGYITQGSHVVLYSPDENQAVGEHDIRGGDEITIDILEFNLVKFKLEGSDEYLVAATLRPETIYGVTNVWIHPSIDYVIASINGERWVVSKPAAWKLSYQGYDVKVVGSIRGEELIGKYVVAPLINRRVPILPASFVDENTGTGIVYSVPAHAPYDYVALMDLKKDEKTLSRYGIKELVESIEPISIIKLPNYGKYPAKDVIEKLGVKDQNDREKLDEATRIVYREEFYSGTMKENTLFPGLSVDEARERTIRALSGQGAWGKMYELEPRKVLTRSGNLVIAAVIKDQWFLNYGNPEWKTKAFKCLNTMKIIPERYRKNFENVFNWLSMRPCARKRGLGTRLPWDPDWIIESLSDSTIYMAYYTIAHRIKSSGLDKRLGEFAKRVIESKGTDSEALNAIMTFFDYILLGKGDPGNVAELFGTDREFIEDMRKEFDYWYPVDERHSGPDLIGSHLSFFVFHHVAIFPERHWPRSMTFNEYVIREGMKMSRSLGNVLPLPYVPKYYGTDLTRLYLASVTDLDTTLDWREDDVASTAGRLMRFWGLVNDIIKEGKPSREIDIKHLSIVTQWLISKVNKTVRDSAIDMENENIRGYSLKAFFDMLSSVEKYLDVANAIGINRDEIRWVLWYVIERWVKLLQPVIPHMAEELWHRMGNNTFVSLEPWPEYDEALINDELDIALDLVEKAIDDVQEILRVTKIAPRAVHLYVGPSSEYYQVVNGAIRLINEGKTMGETIRAIVSNPEYRRMADRVANLVSKVIDGTIPRKIVSRDMELRVFRELSGYIKSRINTDVVVQDATNPTYDPSNKARSSLPGRPAIYVEAVK
ncbi:leucine--tRNA ligase [Vulcanisaeta souniana]|uniref:Leucine--tRNA ligase n=1 Tax=Vulcanisaeta souniana JCM 11219 TaxID=1293586 RepID=A0A830EID6_9CREN|nr:leucine--tRNA ligase [Vulcanisaeta souniana]BDR92307.1 leucine--tRNA ligase [Vulcanisaeta souniana JCM 11219]GGI74598.1 leucine--tRNA ligase [Vulcanisaeta souniana JCM 11219]